MQLTFSAAEHINRWAAGGLALYVGIVLTTPVRASENQPTLTETATMYGILLQSNDLQTKNRSRHFSNLRYHAIHSRVQQQYQDLATMLDQTTKVNQPNEKGHSDSDPGNAELPGVAYRFNLFAIANTLDGDKDVTEFEPAHDIEGDYYTLGGDFRWNDEWLAGVAVGSSESDVEFLNMGPPGQDHTAAKTDEISLYASWYRKDFAVDMSLQYSDTDFSTVRSVQDGVASATSGSQLIGMHLSGAFDFSHNSLSYGPLAAIDLLNGRIDAYKENGNSVWSAQVNQQDVRSAILSMGAQAAYLKGYSWGAIIPYFKGIGRYQIENDRNQISGSLVTDPGASFIILADKPDTTWFEFSTGLSALLHDNVSLYLNYEAIVDYRATNLNNLSLGLNVSF